MGVGSFHIPQIGVAEEWQRPLDWLSIDHLVTASEQKIVMLWAVYPNYSNYVDFQVAGAFNVQITDGTNTNLGSGSAFSKNLSFADFPANTLTKGGYKQAIITITPQSGQNLTNFTFLKLSGITTSYSINVLDMIISMPNAGAGATVPFVIRGESTNLRKDLLERVKVLSIGARTSLESAFRGLVKLKLIDLNNCNGNVTDYVNFASMGYYNTLNYLAQAGELKWIKNFNGASATNFYGAFVGTNLIETPVITSNGITNTSEMFNLSCNIRKIGAINCNGLGLGISNLYSLEWCDAYNIGQNIDFSASKLLSRSALVNIFNNLATVTGKTINITGCLGASSLTTAERAIATGKGWTITG